MGARKSVSTAGMAVVASGTRDLLPQAQLGCSTESATVTPCALLGCG